MTDRDSQIRVNVIKAPINSTDGIEQDAPLSIYIYIAGLFVSESGIYAATYDMANPSFGLILRALVVCGYFVSYWLRKNRVDLKQYQAPLLVVFATVMYFVASTAPELSSATASGGLARPFQIQVVIIWIAVLQSFTLCADSAILFACVPSMALIGIMSSGTPDNEVQFAFVVFLASATFLMVHENHLRTRTAMALRNRSKVNLDNRLIRGEIAIVGCCVVGTMVIATLIATPIEIVGRALIPPSPQNSANLSQIKQGAGANVRVDEGNSIDLGTGPRFESSADLLSMSSNSPVPIPYLRGNTYDYYSGTQFEDLIHDEVHTEENLDGGDGLSNHSFYEGIKWPGRPVRLAHEFDLDPNAIDVGTGKMNGAVEVREVVAVLGGTITHLYGAPSFKHVFTDFPDLQITKSGSVSLSTPLVAGGEYHITSLVPNDNPDALRRSSTNYPASVTRSYLQLSEPLHHSSQRLRKFAEHCTTGLTNPYDKVTALRVAIANQCKYNLQSPAIPRDQDVVEAFLFDLRQGYCDSFAAALTVLCRYSKIPARLASGFILGDRQSDGTYTIREKHRHAWTEVYFTDIGWVPFDATEGTIDITPMNSGTDKSLGSPVRWLTSHGYWPPAIALLVLILLSYVVRTELWSRYRKRVVVTPEFDNLPVYNSEIVRLYLNACSALARSGFRRPLHLTPTEFRLSMKYQLTASSDANSMLAELTLLHQRFAYGSAVATESDVNAARTALSKLKSALSVQPGRVSRQSNGTV